MFGINAELLIDHAWGYEPVTIADIKAYRPQTNSISSGPVSYTHLDVYKRQEWKFLAVATWKLRPKKLFKLVENSYHGRL